MNRPQTVEARVQQFGEAVRRRLAGDLAAAGVSWPPRVVVLLAFKDERRIEVYAGAATEAIRHVHSYPVLAASGHLGPKRREGDRQVPEGFYEVESLNPNSRFHVSLRLNYPSDEDLRGAMSEGRNTLDLGGDIMIHGGAASIGCLAVGDEAAEDLFVLAALSAAGRVPVLISPVDFRSRSLPESAAPDASWVAARYAALATRLKKFAPPSPPATR